MLYYQIFRREHILMTERIRLFLQVGGFQKINSRNVKMVLIAKQKGAALLVTPMEVAKNDLDNAKGKTRKSDKNSQ